MIDEIKSKDEREGWLDHGGRVGDKMPFEEKVDINESFVLTSCSA